MNNPDNAGIHQLFGLVDGANMPAIPKNAIPKVAGFINRSKKNLNAAIFYNLLNK